MSEWWRPRRHWERPPGRFLPATYDAHLPLVNSEAQKKIARAWCGTEAYGWKKSECMAGVLRTLEDPAKVRRLVDSLGPYEKKALGVLRSLGGEAAGREFAFEVASLGIEPPDRSSGYGGEAGAARLLNPLIGHGLLLPRWREDRGSWLGGDPRVGYQETPERVFSDERILRAVEPVAPEPLAVPAVEGPSEGRWRRPGEALLPFLSLAQAMARVGPLQTRSHGAPTPAAWRRLSKEIVRIAKEDGSLPRTLALALATGLAEFDPFDKRISLSKDAQGRLRRPYEEQARGWFDALRSHSSLGAEALGTGGAGDVPGEAGDRRGFPFDLDDSAESLAHSLSLRAVGGLPAIRDGWYDAEAFTEALFQRAGILLEPAFYDSGILVLPSDAGSPGRRAKREKWLDQARRRRSDLHAPRFAALVRGALFESGLLEVAVVPRPRGRASTLFRPTALGAAAMGGRPLVEKGRAPSIPAGAPCAVVQPNFEVVVDLGAAGPGFLHFVERSARRLSSGPAAVYRLERETVCASLDSGESLDSFLGTLGRASAKGIPANVETTLRDWARRREQLVVRGSARLLEYGSRADRDGALAAGVRGTAVGERFLLLDPAVGKRTAHSLARRTVDHALPGARCLEAQEDGSLAFDPGRSDFLAEAEVAAFSDPDPAGRPGRRLVTRESLARAKASGLRDEEIVKRLEARSPLPLPPLLVASIRAADRGTPFAVGEVEVLRVGDRGALRAIATSPRLRGHFAGMLGPDALLLLPGHREKVEEALLGLGFRKGAVPLNPVPEAEERGWEDEEEPSDAVLFSSPRDVRRLIERLARREFEEELVPDGP